MRSILGGVRKANGARGAPRPTVPADRIYRGLVSVIVNLKQSTVPVPCMLLSSMTSSDQTVFVAFLPPSPLRKPRLSSGAKKPTNGACRPGVAIEVGVPLSNVVRPPEQPANP